MQIVDHFSYIKINELSLTIFNRQIYELRFLISQLDKSHESINHVAPRRYCEFFFATLDVAISKLVSRRDAQRSISVTRTIARYTRLRDIAVHMEGAYLAQRYRFEVNAIADRQPAANCRCTSCCIRRDLKDDAFLHNERKCYTYIILFTQIRF